ncbi:MAG TPA: aminotransferase class IV [Clostridiaceae bacterium]|nr:aminotransferase class IV [Clostridiaceae bacterium]
MVDSLGRLADNVGTKYSVNGDIRLVQRMEHLDIKTETIVYEVIRIIDGIPLFFEDHYCRLKNSLKLLGYELTFSSADIVRDIKKLVNSNFLTNCNVKIIVYVEASVQNLIMYVSSSYYPDEEEYKKGIKVSLFQFERQNPNIKLIDRNYRDKINLLLQKNKVFEVLLVNKEGKITEGSKSNVFFVKNGNVYTAPSKYVLQGITRKYVIEACRLEGIEVIEEFIDAGCFDDIEGVFISGTSIKVLPVSRIDNYCFESGANPLVVAVHRRFDKLVEEYISRHR